MEDPSEEFIAEEEVENPSVTLKKLRERLTDAVKEKQEYLEGWQRARADFANFKREESLREVQAEERLRAEFAESLIPVLDSFEMAFKSPSFETASQEWRAGLSSLHTDLLKTLTKLGVESFAPVGVHFDPQTQEAVREVAVSEKLQEHLVVSVERSGYKIGDRVIRPAQVSIGALIK